MSDKELCTFTAALQIQNYKNQLNFKPWTTRMLFGLSILLLL